MGPEGTNALHVSTMEELSSFYTALIPQKKVLTKILLGIGIQICVPSTDTRPKPPQWNAEQQHLAPIRHFRTGASHSPVIMEDAKK